MLDKQESTALVQNVTQINFGGGERERDDYLCILLFCPQSRLGEQHIRFRSPSTGQTNKAILNNPFLNSINRKWKQFMSSGEDNAKINAVQLLIN